MYSGRKRKISFIAVILSLLFSTLSEPAFCGGTVAHWEPRKTNILAAASSFQSLISASCWLFGFIFLLYGVINLFKARKLDRYPAGKPRLKAAIFLAIGLCIAAFPFLQSAIFMYNYSQPLQQLVRCDTAEGLKDAECQLRLAHEVTFKSYLRAAEQGDAFSQRKAGLAYETGQGTQHDDAQALKWYLKAANQGDFYAQFSVSKMYRDGRGVEKNHTEACFWMKIAVQHDKNYLSADEASCQPLSPEKLIDVNARVKAWSESSLPSHPQDR